VACGPAGPEDATPTDDTLAVVTDLATDSSSQPMLEAPRASPRRLALVTASDKEQYHVADEWEVSGGLCEDSRIIQVVARGPGVGIGVMLALPDSGDWTGTYPMRNGQIGRPPARSARFVLQVYGEDRAYVLHGADGSVEVDSAAAAISGRLSAVLFESTFRDSVRAAGSFTAIQITPAGAVDCQLLGDDSTTADRAPPR
jgi:hypothetical protein